MSSDVVLGQLVQLLKQHDLTLRTAESCTAGAIAARVASVAGASDVLDRGWVTYSNASKVEMLGVDETLLDTCGAVSSEVVIAMAEGGASDRDICVAVSGIAGPDGGSTDKPVGTVWIAVALCKRVSHAQCFHFTGDRADVQQQTVEQAIVLLIQALAKL